MNCVEKRCSSGAALKQTGKVQAMQALDREGRLASMR